MISIAISVFGGISHRACMTAPWCIMSRTLSSLINSTSRPSQTRKIALCTKPCMYACGNNAPMPLTCIIYLMVVTHSPPLSTCRRARLARRRYYQLSRNPLPSCAEYCYRASAKLAKFLLRGCTTSSQCCYWLSLGSGVCWLLIRWSSPSSVIIT